MFFRLILPILVLVITPFIVISTWNGGDYRLLLTIFLILQAVSCVLDLVAYSRGQIRQMVAVDVEEAE